MTRIKEVCPVDPGKCNHRIEILRATQTLGSQGQPKRKTKPDNWPTVGSFFAYVETLSGSELDRANTIVPNCSFRIHANWSPLFKNLHSADRLLVDGNMILDIGNVKNVDLQNIKIEILAVGVPTR